MNIMRYSGFTTSHNVSVNTGLGLNFRNYFWKFTVSTFFLKLILYSTYLYVADLNKACQNNQSRGYYCHENIETHFQFKLLQKQLSNAPLGAANFLTEKAPRARKLVKVIK